MNPGSLLRLDARVPHDRLEGNFLGEAGTIVWNGPLGVFEIDRFAKGAATITQAIAGSKACSTAGGAFLEFLEGKTPSAVAALEERA